MFCNMFWESFHQSVRPSVSPYICHIINTRWDTARTHRWPVGLVYSFYHSFFLSIFLSLYISFFHSLSISFFFSYLSFHLSILRFFSLLVFFSIFSTLLFLAFSLTFLSFKRFENLKSWDLQVRLRVLLRWNRIFQRKWSLNRTKHVTKVPADRHEIERTKSL